MTETILSSFYIWYNTLVPSMFPMIIISDILISYSYYNIIPKPIIRFISKLFNISDNATLIFFLSLLSGFPTNGININKAVNENIISKEEGEHLLLFCNFANPLFVLNTIGTFYLKSTKSATIILISHILSNIIIGIIFRNYNYSKGNYIISNNKSQSFSKVLSNAIEKSVESLLLVGATVTLFLILTTLITHMFSLNDIFSLIIKGSLEMTMALSFLASLNVSNTFKVIISTMIISFSGLSIHLQIYSSLNNIKYSNYFKGRIYSLIISGIIAMVISMVI